MKILDEDKFNWQPDSSGITPGESGVLYCNFIQYTSFFFLVLPVYCYQPISLHPRAHRLSHVIMDFSLPDSSVHGFFQARILEWVAISFSIQDTSLRGICTSSWWRTCSGWEAASGTYRRTQHSTVRWVGTLAGLSMAGVSDLMQARKALILRFLSSTAFPSHSLFRLGQVHSLKARASTNSGVCGDFPL